MKSKERPVRFAFKGSDGDKYYFLMKREESGNTDVRKESRVIDMIDYLGNILKHDKECWQFGLSMRSYVIVSMSRRMNLVEWVEGTNTLKNIIIKKDSDLMSRKYLQFEKNKLLTRSFDKFLNNVIIIFFPNRINFCIFLKE
jgi:phosphatidylinositol kinase/protein kinase (PI-3  family)